MQCPIDNETLVMSDRQGIEIDYCPKCRGVWLDRGELDKIIEKSNSINTPPTYQQPNERYSNDNYHSENDYHSHKNESYKKRKKESFLGDIFDF